MDGDMSDTDCTLHTLRLLSIVHRHGYMHVFYYGILASSYFNSSSSPSCLFFHILNFLHGEVEIKLNLGGV